MSLVQKDNQLLCSCGNDVFIPMGDKFGYTVVECKACGNSTTIMESSLIAEKLLSPYGEGYCKVFGLVYTEIVMVDYLVFTEFDIAMMVSVNDRIEKIKLAKQEAIRNHLLEELALLKEESRTIYLSYIKPRSSVKPTKVLHGII